MVQRLLEAEQDVLAFACLAQFELGAPADHFDAVIDEELDAIDQAEFARLSVDDGQHDDAEADLKLGVLVEVVEHHLGLFAALELEDDAHAVAVALVAYIADAFDLLFVDQRRRSLDEARLIHLVGNFGDDDLLAVLGQLLDGSARAQFQLAATRHVGLQDALPSENEAAGGEIGTLHELHDLAPARRVGCWIKWMVALMTSVRLCGGKFVAMPTAMPLLPLTSRFGTRVGRTSGSCSLSS